MNKQLAKIQDDINILKVKKTMVKGKDKPVSVVRNLFFLFVLLTNSHCVQKSTN